MSTKKLLKYKEQIESAKSKQSEISGQIKGMAEQTEKQFDTKTLDGAKDKLKKIGMELDEKEGVFKNDMNELENSYEWD